MSEVILHNQYHIAKIVIKPIQINQMKFNNKIILAILFFAATVFISCKKEKEEPQKLDEQTSQFNSDANFYKSESDQADNDINNSLSEIPAFGKVRSEASILSSPLCGVTIDSSEISQKILYYNFDGTTPCFSPSRTRSGQIKVQLTEGARWSDSGAVLTLTYVNFKVTRLFDSKSIMFNGVKTLKNLNGNNWLGFLTGTSTLRYQARALNMDVRFDNSWSAVWNAARITEWQYIPAGSSQFIPYSHIKFTASGDTTINGQSNIDSWGVNRFGSSFVTRYYSPLVSNTYCGLWRFTSGELVHNVNSKNYTLTMGVDQTGNPTPYACAYGFKVTWIAANNTVQTIVLSY
ncbi:MAG: hypothetical protein DWQ44_06550 [Bacteroidetes bacterium]|nr:MAG: hypothetical protein DWQ33_03020 [Bacteroidota bacterium]REK00957.1 MAG: hypothetical protein DWQ39_10315 [Bacteroidota bacterium]REK34560.1 MAG: hypothetical protein DWQ44_06550 [Bacteroidota bacterium]